MDWLDWSFWQWLGAILVAILAIKVAFSFDINRFFEGRQKSKEKSLKALCPHTLLRPLESGEIAVESCFHSPRGTLSFVCNQCGLVVSDESIPARIAADWASNPDGWIKADERFRKAYSKFYGI